ncbi:hypothetical protein Peetri_00217 [Pseudomonas phage vB_PpuM-Peetri]
MNAKERAAPKFVIKKDGKYHAGSSYATGYGYSNSWSKTIEGARIFVPANFRINSDAGALENTAARLKGKIIQVILTPANRYIEV